MTFISNQGTNKPFFYYDAAQKCIKGQDCYIKENSEDAKDPIKLKWDNKKF